MKSDRTTESARLVALLAQPQTGSPVGAMSAVGHAFQADLVCLQVVSIEGLLVPIAWHTDSQQLHVALSDAVRSGGAGWVRGTASERDESGRVKVEPADGEAQEPFAELVPDAWTEHVGVVDEEGRFRGVLTMLGSAEGGCPPLSDVERSALGSVATLAVAIARQSRRAEKLEGQLEFVSKISEGLAARRTVRQRLKAAVAAAQSATGFDSIQLLTWDPTGHDLLLNVLFIRDVGFVPDRTWDRMTREEIEESSERFLQDPAPMVIPDPAKLDAVPPQHRRWMADNGIRYLVFLPLIFQGEHLGTMVITSHYSSKRTEDRIRTLTAVGGNLAAILQLSLLLAEVEGSYERLSISHRKTIETLALAAEMRDSTTGKHLQHLKRVSLAVGKRLGMSAEELRNLSFGAVTHDIGKLHIPDAVLLKEGPLTKRERNVMRAHPKAGERILIQAEAPEPVRQIARWHHERWDGKGYPDGLSGDEIPLAVQIVTVADVFDALTSERPYKEAWSLEDALAEVGHLRGSQFGPRAVDAFLEAVPELWPEELAKQRRAA